MMWGTWKQSLVLQVGEMVDLSCCVWGFRLDGQVFMRGYDNEHGRLGDGMTNYAGGKGFGVWNIWEYQDEVRIDW